MIEEIEEIAETTADQGIASAEDTGNHASSPTDRIVEETTAMVTPAGDPMTLDVFCAEFLQQHDRTIATAAVGANTSDAPTGTKCVQCTKAIDKGQPWHVQCINCGKPVHAKPSCCKKDVQGSPSCFRCNISLSCTAPRIPDTLIPGDKDHGEHENCKMEFLKAHVLHRNPKLRTSGWQLPDFYKYLFNVPIHPDLVKSVVRKSTQRRRSAMRAQKQTTRQEAWNRHVKQYPNMLYRMTMVNSTPNPVGIRKSQWTFKAEHKTSNKLKQVVHVT